MKNVFRKLIFAAVLVLFVLNLSGCKSEEDKLINEGIKKFENADFAGAAKIYSDVIKKNPKNYLAHIKLASANACIYNNTKMFLNDLLNAINSKSSISMPSEYANEHFMIYQFSKDNPSGIIINKTDEISAFDDAIENNPQNPKLYFGRGLWHYILRHQQDAVNNFVTAKKYDKNFLAAIIMKGKSEVTYFGPGNFLYNETRAKLISIFDFKRALKLDPPNSNLMMEIGTAYSRINSLKGAAKYLSMAAQADSNNIGALFQRIAFETVRGNYKMAVEDYKIIVKKFPDNANYLIELATKRIMAGELKEALKDLEKAKTLAKYKEQIELIESLIEKNHLKK